MKAARARIAAHRRRAGVAVQVAVMSTVILGMGALAVDLGAMYTVQNELQVAADAAALAAAARLSEYESGSPEQLALDTAEEYAERHRVWEAPIGVGPDDVELGQAVYDPATERFEFAPGGANVNAVRVTVRRTTGSESGPLPLLFANIFGVREANLRARAAAVLVPRDISVVIDLSNSMCYDSTLRWDRIHRDDGGYCNLRDIWCALDGPEPPRPYQPADAQHVDETAYLHDTGPTYGAMTAWGDPLVPYEYDPKTDPGLWFIPRKGDSYVRNGVYDCTEPAARASLEDRGYSDAEIAVLLSAANDYTYSTQWLNRVKVILGLAVWHSGKPGGLAPAGGNGNDLIGNAEVEEIVPPPEYAYNWDWDDYVNNRYSRFERRFGLKTLVNYMLNSRPYSPRSMEDALGRAATYNLWATPEEPLRAVKDAALAMVETLEARQSPDRMALEVFCGHASTWTTSLDASRHEVDLTDEMFRVPERAYEMQTAHYDVYTNIGGGMWRALCELKSERARRSAAKVMVVLSDGYPNRHDERTSLPPELDTWDDPENPQSWSDGMGYALAMARIAARNHVQIHSIGVGYDFNPWILQEIARIGGGVYRYASGDPTQYTNELREIFQQLGGMRAAVLIE